MAISALWKASNRPALNVMADAPLLIDGNTATGYSASDSEAGHEVFPCVPIQATAEITGVWVGGGIWNVTGIDIALAATNTGPGFGTQCNQNPGDPPFLDEKTRSYAIEQSPDGSSWVAVASGSLPNTATVQLVSWSGAPFLARYVRVVVVSDFYLEGIGIGLIESVSYLNEITITGTEMVPDPPPDPDPDPDPDPVPDGDPVTTIPPAVALPDNWDRNCGPDGNPWSKTIGW